MAKITLTDLVNLQNETTAVNAINNNSTAIETAMENTLSRDGTSPNQMNANLDMNNNRILNLPFPVSDTEPARLVDVEEGISGTIEVGTVSTLSPGSPATVVNIGDEHHAILDFGIPQGVPGAVGITGTPSAGEFGVWSSATTLKGVGLNGIVKGNGASDPTVAGTGDTLTIGSIELGAATDTTITRTGAGAIAVEGVGVALNSTSQVHTASTIELGNASDTTLSRASAGQLAVEGVSVSMNSTSATHTAGTIELGAATDTTLSRASAGVLAVEGVNLTANLPQNSQSAAYTAVLSDANTHIFHPSSDNNPRTFTIPANASVAYPIGTQLTFINKINTVTIAITSDTLTMAGTGSTGSRTLAANGMATAIKIATTEWIISGAGLT